MLVYRIEDTFGGGMYRPDRLSSYTCPFEDLVNLFGGKMQEKTLSASDMQQLLQFNNKYNQIKKYVMLLTPNGPMYFHLRWYGQ